MRKERKNRGVTIVEAMIVLVAIGLLLGGILKGSELINHAKAMALTDRVTSLRTAWHTFVNRYDWEPGDFPLASEYIEGSLPDGDGQFGFESEETAIAMNHLRAASLIRCTVCVEADISNATSTSNHPGNQFGGVLSFFAQGDRSSYVYTPFDTPGVAISVGRGVPHTILSQLDRKLDDGEPHRGLFRAAANPPDMEDISDCVALFDHSASTITESPSTVADIYSRFTLGAGSTEIGLIWRTAGVPRDGTGAVRGGIYLNDNCLAAHLL